MSVRVGSVSAVPLLVDTPSTCDTPFSDAENSTQASPCVMFWVRSDAAPESKLPGTPVTLLRLLPKRAAWPPKSVQMTGSGARRGSSKGEIGDPPTEQAFARHVKKFVLGLAFARQKPYTLSGGPGKSLALIK